MPNLLPKLHTAVGLLLTGALLGGCEPEAAGAGAPVASPAQTAGLTIKDLNVPSRSVIGAEVFELNFGVESPGSGTVRSYGLSTRLGSKVYPIKTPIPVIFGGKVTLTAAGPLPDVSVGGQQDVAFWVVDDTGRESNRLTFKMLVQ